ncbi:MAG: hypothetical protein QXJ62_06215 [Nitrososphaeria archaeon]
MSWEEFLDKLEKDDKARKRLAEIIVTDYDVRIALINAVLRDVATKHDVMELRNEVKEEVTRLGMEFKNYVDKRVDELNARLDSGNKRIDDVNKRIDEVNKRIDDVNKRFDDINKRIDDLNHLVRTSLIAIVVTLATTILVPLILKFLAL